MKHLSYRYGLLSSLILSFTLGCNEAPIEPEKLALKQLLPYVAFVRGPVFIEGQGFSEHTVVHFENHLAKIWAYSPTQISTSIPSALVGIDGQILMTVSDGDQQAQSFIRIQKEGYGFEEPFNAPRYPLTSPNTQRLNFTAYPTIDCQDSVCLRQLENVFGYQLFGEEDNLLELSDTMRYQNSQYVASSMVGEEFGDLSYHYEVRASYLPQTNLFSLYRDRNLFSSSSKPETLTGGFHRLTVSTPQGTKTGTYLYLISEETGLPYLFEPK